MNERTLLLCYKDNALVKVKYQTRIPYPYYSTRSKKKRDKCLSN